MKILLLGLKGLGMYLLKRYAAEVVFDVVMEAADKAATSTKFTQIDDEVVAKIKADKEAILSFFK